MSTGRNQLYFRNIDFSTVLGVLGALLFFFGFVLLGPIVIALIYHEQDWYTFLISAAISFATGALLYILFKPQREVRIREGFLIVSLTWLFLSLVGALPFVISGSLHSYTDAVFETMSGLTTTGATIFGSANPNGFVNPPVESLSKSILFWRSLTHWVGGMGIIVLTIAILPLLGIGGMRLFKAESPGPTADKLTPRVQDTAKFLWGAYLVLTVVEFLLLWPSMGWFDAINHTFATVATGGFSTKNASVGAFHSVYIDTVITIFMFLSGMSFALHFRLLRGDIKSFFKNRESRFYTLFTAISIIVIAFSLWFFNHYTVGNALRYSSFQAVSIITTTGFTTDNFTVWNHLGALFLFLLFFAGSCAGSTAGGPKMIRWMIFLRSSFRELKQTIHPKAVLPLRIGDKVITSDIQRSVLTFFLLYMMAFIIGALILSAFGFNIISSAGASISCLGNSGPVWGIFAAKGLAIIPNFGKWTLIFLMMIGRLEIFTVIVIFSSAFWKD
jgi:trk system potassium uptake protein TrkH